MPAQWQTTRHHHRPIREPRNRKLTAKILNKVQAITVRDFESRTELLEMGVYREVLVAVDPVLGVDTAQIDAALGIELLQKDGTGFRKNTPTLMVAARTQKMHETVNLWVIG